MVSHHGKEPHGQLSGKICMVTGATSGIGAVTARELARLGATMVLVGRNQAKAEATAAKIMAETGNRAVEILLADLSSQADIHRIAEEFQQRHKQLHVLVNNAGAVYEERQESVDGVELTFALNHLSYFLLTNLLLDILKQSGPARIVNVSSEAHRGVRINFDDLQARRRYRGFQVYGQSKLANILFTIELARRLGGSGVTTNALHPGVVATGFGLNNRGWIGIAFGVLLRPFIRTPERGAETSIYLAAAPEVAGVTGRYFANKRPARPSAAARDLGTAQRLWQISTELTKLPEVVAVADG